MATPALPDRTLRSTPGTAESTHTIRFPSEDREGWGVGEDWGSDEEG